MKRIRELDRPTPGLAEYRERDGDAATWEGFGSHGGSSDAKQELMLALEELQHRLCGYCEVGFPSQGRQLEHVIARSDAARGGARRALDHTNIIACCDGGQRRHHDSRKTVSDVPSRRYRLSCGQRKGDDADAGFLDPRRLPSSPSLMRVSMDGLIAPDCPACAVATVETGRVERTIETLGLNVPRLREARRVQWGLAQEDYNQCGGDIGRLRATAKRWLLPDGDGKLPAFFTTARSVFGTVAEQILAEAGQPWV